MSGQSTEATESKMPRAAARALPVAPGGALLGSLGPMLRDPLRFLVATHRSLGPVFRLRVLNRRFVVIAGTEANQFMIGNERKFLQNKPIFGGFGAELGGELFLASADGETHKRLRRIQTPRYSPEHLESRVPEVVEGVRRLPREAPAKAEPWPPFVVDAPAPSRWFRS